MTRTSVLLALAALTGGALLQAQSPASLKISIKGSATYASQVDAPLATALLVATTRWDKLAGSGPGGAAAVGDATAVLSTTAIDCAGVFTAPPPDGDAAVTVFAGAILLFPDKADWTKTTLGAALTDPAAADARVPVQRFAITVMNNKKGVFSKDAVDAKNGELVFARTGGTWTAQLSVRDSKVQATGTVPLKLCPPEARTSNFLDAKRPKTEPVLGPLLGAGAMLEALMKYR